MDFSRTNIEIRIHHPFHTDFSSARTRTTVQIDSRILRQSNPLFLRHDIIFRIHFECDVCSDSHIKIAFIIIVRRFDVHIRLFDVNHLAVTSLMHCHYTRCLPTWDKADFRFTHSINQSRIDRNCTLGNPGTIGRRDIYPRFRRTGHPFASR